VRLPDCGGLYFRVKFLDYFLHFFLLIRYLDMKFLFLKKTHQARVIYDSISFHDYGFLGPIVEMALKGCPMVHDYFVTTYQSEGRLIHIISELVKNIISI